ncbi:MAG: type II toxin-antitoxin system RelE/ParE family toxin [Alphaproteobacteria bacterium]|jgi:mRNA interferase RelE/StbE|nr:type II toxin-antitoxin system RelE/ParE family toxin [Alphaproteobacteria bacterium]
MAWRIEFDAGAERDLAKLDDQTAQRILKFLYDRVAKSDDPRSSGEAMKGKKIGNLWRYRVGDDRIIVNIQDVAIRILVLRIGHRREIYRNY